MKVGEKIKVVHPKCKELFGTVERIVNPSFPREQYEATTVFGYQDWYESIEEAKAWIVKDNESEYNGSAASHRASEDAYAKHESSMLSGY